MSHQRKPLLYALLVSLLIHLVFLFGPHIALPRMDVNSPLTVDIQTLPPLAAVKPQVARHAVKSKAEPSRRAPIIPDPNPSPAPVSLEPEPSPPQAMAQAPEPSLPAPPPTPVAPTMPPTDLRADFPARIDLVYSVYRGTQGLLLGKTTHTWNIVENHYLLTSTTEASGLFSLFYSGRYVMTSRGELTPAGLKPISFWIQRGQSSERTEIADFNWATNTLRYGKYDDLHNAPLIEGSQDQLSALYQLAFTAPHSGRVSVAITTGRKLNQYTYQVVGEETLQTPLGALRTEHLASVQAPQDSNGSGDIWLAIDQHYLPVRFKLTTSAGVLDQVISSLRVP
jgi:hypothetical protein